MSKSPFKNTLILLGAFLVLLLFVLFFASDSARQSSKRNIVDKSYLSQSLIESTDRIVITNNSAESVELIESDEEWLIEGRAVDVELSNEFIEKLTDMPTGRAVSKNPDNWSEFGLQESSTNIRLFNGDEELTVLYFGTATPGPGGIFMRRDSDSSVYKVVTSLHQYQYYDKDQWMSKDLITVEMGTLSSFTARIGDEKWSFEKKSGAWDMLVDGVSSPVENVAGIQSYLEILSNLKAAGFEHDSSLFGEADQALSLQFDDGSEYIVSVDVQDESKVYARVTDGYDLFVLSTDLESHLRPAFLDVEESEEGEAVNE